MFLFDSHSPFATIARNNMLVTSQIMSIIAFLLMFAGTFFISIFTYARVFALLVLFLLGLPAFIMSQILWCYKMKFRTILVYGIWSLLAAVGCVTVGMYLILYPRCRYSYSGCDDYRTRFLEHTTSSWKPFGIIMLVDSVLWFASAYFVFYFYYRVDKNQVDNPTGDGRGISGADEESGGRQPQEGDIDQLCVCL